MFRFLEYLVIAAYIAVLLVVSHWIGQLSYSWMPPEATAEAQKVDYLFSFLVSVGAFIFLGLVGMMVYSVLFFRASPKDYSEGHPSRGDVRLEILWTATPTILVLWIAFQGFNIYQQLNILGLQQIVHLHLPLETEKVYAAEISDVPKPASETIEVFVKQWDWSFRYPNNVTSHELHLPVNVSTRLNMHAKDVLHSFYVPEFRLQQYIVPERNIDLVLTPIHPGKYHLKDSLFSGTYFALMETNVYVESQQAYNQWLTQTAAGEPTPSTNQAVAEYTQPPKTFFKTSWYTVTPARSSVVAGERKVNNDT
ncbi:cytochrome c oxidase subunit II [Nostocaceae cyanobacterium CENA369]|uniref:Cytochrome c oxidase subunit 2 n=1 Tax=Dendronalium phyllosphericum CENA369 TaxID=1725256 RepID=A0A8J7I2G6_9NOST|nr:cytochrome c oxidase subunit II [Dendronalium phyllosphericum]MBH8571701.1 cytochrome c oxidase subunit II [Dendronalium phyllosphericum CENA369]